MGNNKPYSIDMAGNRLTFKTAFFRAEEGSMLHAGIYNRELASSLAAGGTTLMIFLAFLFAGFDVTFIFLIPAIIMFVGFFLFFRVAVFYEESLEAVIDKSEGMVTVWMRKFFGTKESYPLNELRDIKLEHVVISPENPNGIEVVEKVALQHGTVIPGFGEVKEFHTVELEFKGGRRFTIFSSKEQSEATDVQTRLTKFIIA